MYERNQMVVAIVREVRGPREGPEEILPENQDPRDEYITGVLEPARAPRATDDPEADAGEVIVEVSTDEESGDQEQVVVPSVFSPALDPRSLPRSVGLSFTVQAEAQSRAIEICATWARYEPHEHGWQRVPAGYLTGPVCVDQDMQWFAGEGVSLRLRSRPLSHDRWRISLFLVNVTEVEGDGRASTEQHLFQPQIRVHCCKGTRLLPVLSPTDDSTSATSDDSLDIEEASLTLLYRERGALARGHLCGATWLEIDPERTYLGSTIPESAPFIWTDAAQIPEEERGNFSPADVRTELVPCYPIEAPHMDWNHVHGPPPILNPETLAEIWDPEEVREQLQPLIDGYNAWITGQEVLLADLPVRHHQAAQLHLNQCHEAADRIANAIDILATDEEVQLAFCFANRAIALQSVWARGHTISWRPFQLAFILLNIPALANPLCPDRRICDLLWFPTGGGKTEAYLGLAAFTLALRRLRASHNRDGDCTGAGVGVLSRYTLRLLTIQQFRRALKLITACEVLRVWGLDSPGSPVGWRPRKHPNRRSFLWGTLRFSAGLWVGGNVAPNKLYSVGPIPGPTGMTLFLGALEILEGAARDYSGPNQALRNKIQNSRHLSIGGEPAQVLNCPCCDATLAIPDTGLGNGQHTIHFVLRNHAVTSPPLAQLLFPEPWLTLDQANIHSHGSSGCATLSLTFTVANGHSLTARQLDEWWYHSLAPALGSAVELAAVRPARPGYFFVTYTNVQSNEIPCDFEIFCPNPSCELNQHAWAEQVPVSRATHSAIPSGAGPVSRLFGSTARTAELPLVQGFQWQVLPPWCRFQRDQISGRIPIPAMTVDDQIYNHCPSLVVATVDKFARLAFEPRASSLFGNVDHYHSRSGYYREGCPPPTGGNLPTSYQSHPTLFARGHQLHVPVSPFQSPDLILQDELHLIEGPLGSMVGLYETAVDLLCQRQHDGHSLLPKYIASTATVRQAGPQVQALYDRTLAQFPPWAVSANDRFFAREEEIHPLDSNRPGRLYLAICAPGKGAQTPIIRIWSTLLQTAYELWQSSQSNEADQFYTLVGYFNAIRELAGALSLYRQDIPQRMDFQFGQNARLLDRKMELSGRVSSMDLPVLLQSLETTAPDALDVVLATSMFGTGVDVDRLGLMVVHGQPKTTASYIQATGRVGRQSGGLVVTFLRASRPRDLDHFEFFTGYHRALYRHVEPITVAPYSPRARERALGPLAVVLLRQAAVLGGNPVDPEWRVQQRISGGYHALAHRMASHRHDPEVNAILDILEARAGQQPPSRRPIASATAHEAASELDRWASLAHARSNPDTFVYNETAFLRPPERHVVLGDAQHRANNLLEAFENAPQSLREVEETTGFRS